MKRDPTPTLVASSAECKKLAKASSGIVTVHHPAEGLARHFDVIGEIRTVFDNASRARLQACADRHLADAREIAADERATGLPAGSLRPDALAEHLQECELWPEDSELVAAIRHMFMTNWGMDREQADARMGRLDWAEAVAVVA